MKDFDKELTKLAERLTVAAIEESDPRNWPGTDSTGALLPARDMDASERGDLVWHKKSAAGTLGLLQKVHSLIGAHNAPTADKRSKAAAEADASEHAALIASVEAEMEKLYAPGGALHDGTQSYRGEQYTTRASKH